MTLLRTLDLPPVWLMAFLGIAWAQVAWLPGPVPMPVPGWAATAGAVVALSGFALILAAGWQMWRARTTIIPRRDPVALVTGGVFAISRNPIYLGDALILGGLCLRWGALSGVVLVPAFMVLISRRFIAGEEARLKAAFGRAYDGWSSRTRRWL